MPAMTTRTEGRKVGRKKANPGTDKPVGPLLVKNLHRLGFADVVVRSAEVARLVAEKTGRPMSRQRIASMMNAVRVEPETLDTLAKALGVKVADLLQDDEPPPPKPRRR